MFIKKHLNLLALPLLYWVAKQMFFSSYGLYTHYNKIEFTSIQNFILLFLEFIYGAVFLQLRDLKVLWLSHGALPILFLGMLFFLLIRICGVSLSNHSDKNEASPLLSYRSAMDFLFFSLFLLTFAILPYIAVGKVASFSGWGSRHAILVSLPVAIFFVGIFRFVKQTFTIFHSPSLRNVCAVFFVISFTLISIENYIDLQSRWIKDRSLIENLKIQPKDITKKINVFIVNDHYRIPSNDAGYDFYEYAGLFKMAFHSESRVGFIPSARLKPSQLIDNFPLQRYLLKDFQPIGCSAELTIDIGSLKVSKPILVFKYLKYRFFGYQEMKKFLQSVTSVKLSNILCE